MTMMMTMMIIIINVGDDDYENYDGDDDGDKDDYDDEDDNDYHDDHHDFPCTVCKTMFPCTEYYESQWKNRLQRNATCIDCLRIVPTCPCKVCRKILPHTAYEEGQWIHRLERNASCKDCPVIVPTCPCKVCRKIFPRTEYEDGQWHNRLERNASCRDCLHPKCTNPDCRTCPRCHNGQCKIKSMQCTKVFEHKQSTLPQNEEELARCLCPTCVFTCSQVCCKEPNTTKARSRRLTQGKRWTCADCLQSALQEKNKQHQ